MATLLPGVTGRRSGAAGKAQRQPRKAPIPGTEIPLTLSVPEAGKLYFGMSRNGSYAAAERGEIPTVRVGKLLRVPVRAMDAMLDAATGKTAKGRAA